MLLEILNMIKTIMSKIYLFLGGPFLLREKNLVQIIKVVCEKNKQSTGAAEIETKNNHNLFVKRECWWTNWK